MGTYILVPFMILFTAEDLSALFEKHGLQQCTRRTKKSTTLLFVADALEVSECHRLLEGTIYIYMAAQQIVHKGVSIFMLCSQLHSWHSKKSFNYTDCARHASVTRISNSSHQMFFAEGVDVWAPD